MHDESLFKGQQLAQFVGKVCKAQRVAQNISQSELSEISGVSKASITRFETGKGNISLLNFLALMEALNILDDFKNLFDTFNTSPSLQTRKPSMRVRHSSKPDSQTSRSWQWKEDQS